MMATDYGWSYAGQTGQRSARSRKPGRDGRPDRRLARLVPALLLPVADLVALTVAVLAAGRPGLPSAAYALAVLVLLAGSGLHRLRICLRVSDQVGRILGAVALPLAGLLVWLPAGQSARLALWSAGMIIAVRVAACAVLRMVRSRGRLAEPTLLVGSGTLGAHLAELMRQHPELGLRPMGFLDDGPPRRDLSVPTLGTPAELAEVVTRLAIRRVVVCYAVCKDEDLVSLLRASRSLRADVSMVPRLYEVGAAIPRACLDEIWGIPLVPLRGFGHAGAARLLKRSFDVVAASLLLAVATPVLLVLGALLRLRSGSNPIFRQNRVTADGQVASILKLRTLPEDPDADIRWTVPARQVPPLARLLRATHLDELPQLVNVLRGDMSLVGPRPERPYFAEQFSRDVLRYGDRTRVPAGLTGWAQVHGLHGDTSIVDRARFDNQYIEYWSVWLDVVIMARTISAALVGRGGGRP